MRIIISVPSVSLELAEKAGVPECFLDLIEFDSRGCTLDVFGRELSSIEINDAFVGINVPGFCLSDKGGRGVAGPGGDAELFIPSSLGDAVGRLSDGYDRWRPYPMSSAIKKYDKKVARKYCKKRCRIFKKLALGFDYGCLFYVEHAVSSCAHVDEAFSLELLKDIFDKVSEVESRAPFADLVFFSPYGINSNGVVARNAGPPEYLSTWGEIRSFICEQ